MTDKFEKWLESNLKRLADYLKLHDAPFDRGLELAYTLTLEMYREFLKEPEIREQQEKDEQECKLIDEAGELWEKKQRLK